MKHKFTSRFLACLAFLAMLWPLKASAAPFTPGNVVVVRVGDGAATLGSASTAVFLVEYTTTGTLVQTIALPTADAGTNQTLTISGSSTADGSLTRSADGRYLVLAGYDAAPGLAAIAGTASAATNRIIGRIAADGSIDTSTRIDDAFSAGNFRSAATANGTTFYGVGSVSGVRSVAYGSTGASTAISSGTPTNLRVVNVAGGNLYITTASGSTFGVAQVGTGLPTTAEPITLLPGFPSATGPSSYGFYFADLSTTVAGLDVVYVADDRSTTAGGIQKWSLVGGTWTLNGTIGGLTTAALRGVSGSVTGSTVSLAASGGGGLFFVTDNAGYNAAPSTATLPAAIATAAMNTAFRGVAFAPEAGTATPAPTLTSFTPTTGAAGTTVTLTGTNFTGATAVTIGGVTATFTVVNATTITLTVPATAMTGTIAVTTPGGTVTSSTTFTVPTATPAPTITLFTPATGAAGATVTVTGTNFTGATAVTLNGVVITNFTVVNATTITFAVPAGATSGLIAVTTAGGTATSATSFTVGAPVPAPTITSFTPARAYSGLGFTLVVNGTNLVAGTVINFNGNNYTGTILGSSGTGYTVVIPASGVPAPGTYPITATNSGGTSAPLTLIIIAPSTGTPAYEDFEQGTKTGYATGVVMLRSGAWTFTEALIGNLFNDKVTGIQSARIRPNGFIAMNYDKPNGAGVVSFNAALYGSDAAATFALEVSTDGGTTYSVVAGAPAALTTTMTPYTFAVNRAGNVRLRISNTTTAGTTPRINIDDLNIADFIGSSTREASQAQLSVYPNPAADAVTVRVSGSTAGLPVQVRDLLGRPVLSTTLPASGQLSLRGLSAGTYLLTVDGQLTRRIVKE